MLSINSVPTAPSPVWPPPSPSARVIAARDKVAVEVVVGAPCELAISRFAPRRPGIRDDRRAGLGGLIKFPTAERDNPSLECRGDISTTLPHYFREIPTSAEAQAISSDEGSRSSWAGVQIGLTRSPRRPPRQPFVAPAFASRRIRIHLPARLLHPRIDDAASCQTATGGTPSTGEKAGGRRRPNRRTRPSPRNHEAEQSKYDGCAVAALEDICTGKIL
jgi:hypothetical protein